MSDLQVLLNTVNGASTEELQQYKQIIMNKLRVSFKVRDRVQFDAGYRGVITGTITKINPKSIGILSDSGTRWTAYAEQLSKVS